MASSGNLPPSANVFKSVSKPSSLATKDTSSSKDERQVNSETHAHSSERNRLSVAKMNTMAQHIHNNMNHSRHKQRTWACHPTLAPP